MPNIKSAIKRMRSDAKKQEKNQTAISELKTLEKTLRSSLQDAAKTKEYAERLVSRYDRAVTRGIIPRGRADRKKSRIAHLLASLKKKK